MEKICACCRAVKLRSEFHKNKSRKDGLCTICKDCNCAKVKAARERDPELSRARKKAEHERNRSARIERMRAYRLENIESIRDYDRARGKLRTKEVIRSYYTRNPEAAKLRAKEWVKKNKAKRLDIANAYAARNRDLINKKAAEYRRANPHKGAEKAMRRYALKVSSTPKWASKEKILDVYAVARKATQETGILHHVDHIVPLKHDLVSGLHCEANLQVLTSAENIAKSNRWWPDMP